MIQKLSTDRHSALSVIVMSMVTTTLGFSSCFPYNRVSSLGQAHSITITLHVFRLITVYLKKILYKDMVGYSFFKKQPSSTIELESHELVVYNILYLRRETGNCTCKSNWLMMTFIVCGINIYACHCLQYFKFLVVNGLLLIIEAQMHTSLIARFD